MVREIKFRAWDKQNSAMYLDCQKRDSLSEKICRPSEWVLMQFTGLKDKNGKEIYEGDIIRIPYQTDDIDCILRKVYYDDKNARFSTDDFIGDDSDDILTKGIAVIGNIYENPELLKARTE